MTGVGVDHRHNDVSLAVADGPFLAPTLGRVVGMLAARADCPIDRLSDVLLVADAVAAKAGPFSDDGRVGVHVLATSGFVELRVGPLRPGGADELLEAVALPGIGNVVERVADEVESSRPPDDLAGMEHLLIRLRFAVRGERDGHG